ncbi:MAG: hypothetical protein IPN89_04535 [Saprospiraceae bacterium]|nr:hypothetical protein [Saprospiraceae bacterium]MBL0099009.1 hypothetical protein [Saprospiraceae bacterium]
MKNIIYLLVFLVSTTQVSAQEEVDSTGLPGDQFSLEAVLDVFEKAESPEAFEKLINEQDKHVNNLDLNGDGEVDYVKVISKQDGDLHIFILQVPVSDSENQDIAVIELEKTGKDKAILQIVGDEDIYGEEVIVEPSEGEDDIKSEGVKKGPLHTYTNRPAVIVNVWVWPCVRFVYAPGYKPWVSPWRWRFYPSSWRPWRPLGWAIWHPIRFHHYHPRIRVVHTHRVVNAHKIYKPVRVTSTTVRTRHATAHANYKVTKTKTRVTGPRGNSAIKKTTTVKGPKGHVKAQKTTVKRGRRG